jgi:hypothetical protein
VFSQKEDHVEVFGLKATPKTTDVGFTEWRHCELRRIIWTPLVETSLAGKANV